MFKLKEHSAQHTWLHELTKFCQSSYRVLKKRNLPWESLHYSRNTCNKLLEKRQTYGSNLPSALKKRGVREMILMTHSSLHYSPFYLLLNKARR